MVKPLKALHIQRMLVHPDTLHELVATGDPHQLQRGLIEKCQPMFIGVRPPGPPEKSAARVRLYRQFAFTSENLTGQAELTQRFGDHRVQFGL